MTTHRNAPNRPSDLRDAVAEDLRTSGAYAAGFNDLAVNASDIKTFTDAQITPDISKSFSALKPPLSNKWYGSDSRQALMQFTAYVIYDVPDYYPVSQILSDPEQRKMISNLVDRQLKHMFGAFTTHPDFVFNPGIPSSDYTVNLLGAEEVPGGLHAKISYSYSDIVVFSKSLLSGSGLQRIKFVLPKDPVTIYKKGFSRSSSKNLCTDEHYNTEYDFWYFWNPYKEGCPIDDGDLVTVQTDLKPMDVTRDTYPEYTRLYGGNGGGEALQVTYLVGVNANFDDGDVGKETFQNAFAGLHAAGFKVTMDKPEHKRLSFCAGAKCTSVDMRLMDSRSSEFGGAAARGMQTADIFLYDGHSGLGGNLNIDRLSDIIGQPLTLPNKYQIFFFRGCSTYAYYNHPYFKLKSSDSDPKGTKNLDIITTGIGAKFAVGAKADVAFLTSIAFGQRPSWQTIIDRINAAEGELSALTHVNGDEDNPQTP